MEEHIIQTENIIAAAEIRQIFGVRMCVREEKTCTVLKVLYKCVCYKHFH